MNEIGLALDIYESWTDFYEAYSSLTQIVFSEEIGLDKFSAEGLVNLPEASLYKNIVLNNEGLKEILFDIKSIAKFEGKIELKEKGKLKIKSESSVLLRNIVLSNIDELEIISKEGIWSSGIVGNSIKLEAAVIKIQNHFTVNEVKMNGEEIDNQGIVKLKELGLFNGEEIRNSGYIICEETRICNENIYNDKGICGVNNEIGDRCDIEVIGEKGIYNTGSIAGRNIKLESEGKIEFSYSNKEGYWIALRAWHLMKIKGDDININQSIKSVSDIEIEAKGTVTVNIIDDYANEHAKSKIESKSLKIIADRFENQGSIVVDKQDYTIKNKFKNICYSSNDLHYRTYNKGALSGDIEINAGSIENNGVIGIKSIGSILAKLEIVNDGVIFCNSYNSNSNTVEKYYLDAVDNHGHVRGRVNLGYYFKGEADLLCDIKIKSDNGEIKSSGVIGSRNLEIEGKRDVELGKAQIDHVVNIGKKPESYIYATDKVVIKGGKIELHDKYQKGMYVGKELEMRAYNEVDINSLIVVNGKFNLFAKSIVNRNKLQAHEFLVQDSEKFKNEGEILGNIEVNSSLEIVNYGKIAVATIAKLHGEGSIINDGAISCKDGVNIYEWKYQNNKVTANIGYNIQVIDSGKFLCNIEIKTKGNEIRSSGIIVGRKITIESNGELELGKVIKAQAMSNHQVGNYYYLYSEEDTVIKATNIYLGNDYKEGLYAGKNLQMQSVELIDSKSVIRVKEEYNLVGKEVINKGEISSKKINLENVEEFINEGIIAGDLNILAKGRVENKGIINIDVEGKIDADKGIINNGAIACRNGVYVGDHKENLAGYNDNHDNRYQFHINYYLSVDDTVHCKIELKSLNGNIEIKEALGAKEIRIQSGKSVILGVKELPKSIKDIGNRKHDLKLKLHGIYLWGHNINIEGSKVLVGKNYDEGIKSTNEFVIEKSGNIKILGKITGNNIKINGNNLENLGEIKSINYETELKTKDVERGELKVSDSVNLRGEHIVHLGNANTNNYVINAKILYSNKGVINANQINLKSAENIENAGDINLKHGGKAKIESKKDFNNKGKILAAEVRWCDNNKKERLCGSNNEEGYSGSIQIISEEGEITNTGIIGSEEIEIEAKKKIKLVGNKGGEGYSVLAWKNLRLNGEEILIDNQVKSVHNIFAYSREKITSIELLQSNNEIVLNSDKVIEIYGKESKIISGGKTTKVRAAKIIFGNSNYNSNIELSGAIQVNAGEIYNSKDTKLTINGIGYINVDSITNEGELIIKQNIAINVKGDFKNQGKFTNEVILNLELGGLKLGEKSLFGKEVLNIQAKNGDFRGAINASEFNFRLKQNSLNLRDNLNVSGEAKLLLDNGYNIYVGNGYKVSFSKTEIRTETDEKIGGLLCRGCDLEFGHNTMIKANKIKLEPIIYERENKLISGEEVLCKKEVRRILGIKASPKKTYTYLDIYEQPQYSEQAGSINIKGDAFLEFDHFRIFISNVGISGNLLLLKGSKVLEIATSGSKKFLDIKCLGNMLSINDVQRITGFNDGDIVRYQSYRDNPFFGFTQSSYQIYKYYNFLESRLDVGSIEGEIEYLILSSTNQLPVFTEQPNFELIGAGEKALTMSDEFSSELSKLINNLKGGKDKSIANGAKINSKGNIELGIRKSIVADPYTEINGGAKVGFRVEGNVVSGADIRGESVRFETQGNLVSVGDIDSIEDIIIKAINIIIAGQIKAGKEITIESLHNTAIMTISRVIELKGTNYNGILSQITTETEILSKSGDINVKGDNIGIIGAKLEGKNIRLDSKGKVHIVAVELYNKIEMWTDRYYYDYQSKHLKKPTINSKDGGSIYINSGGGILLSGLEFQSDQKGQITSNQGVIVENPVEWESLTIIKKKSGFLGLSSTKTTEKNYGSCPVDTNFYSKGMFEVKSEGDQSWEGVQIIAYGVRLEAGSVAREASISIIPAFKEKGYELYVEKTKFVSFDKNMLNVAYKEKSASKFGSKNVVPSIIQVEDEFLGYVNGRWEQLSTEIKGNRITIKATDEIKLGIAPDMEYTYTYLSKKGIGVGFNANGDEFAVKAAVWGSKYEFSQTSYTHQATNITANFIQLEGDRIEDFGIIYNAQEMHENARIIFHGIAKNRISTEEYKEEFSAGFKMGIKSNLGSILRGGKAIKDQDYSKPEGYINGFFAGLETYHNTLKLLSDNANNGVTGGVWFYGKYNEQRHEVEQTIAVPTIINIKDLYKSESEELKLLGTQIETYRSYIKTKYLDVKAAESTLDSKTSESGFDVEVPISGSIIGNIGNVISKANQHQRLQMNVDIQVKDYFRLDVQGHADMRGVFLRAGNLEANFESLLLESAQDIIRNDSNGISLGVSGSKLGIEGFSGGVEKSKGNRHVVERITAMIGEESAHIVVANALRLNGAMIANAQRNEDGSYTDHGNIVLKVGELFIQHIHDYDEGYTLGASLSTSKKYDNIILKPTLGGYKKAGGSKSTIGNGNIECIGAICEFDKVEGDINNIQYMDTKYNVDPIKMYWSNIDTEWLKDGIAKKDGKIDISEVLKRTADAYKREFNEAFAPIWQYIENMLPKKEETKDNAEYKEENTDNIDGAEDIEEEEKEDIIKVKKEANNEESKDYPALESNDAEEETILEEEQKNQEYVKRITLKYEEGFKKEISDQSIRNINREIDNIRELTSEQKNELKELTKSIIGDYVNADAGGKAKIVNSLHQDLTTLQREIKNAEEKGAWSKVSSYLGKALGLQEANANAVTAIYLTGKVAAEALFKLGAMVLASIGAMYVAKEVVDKKNENSYKSIKSDDSNDKNKQNIKQQPGSAAATGAPDPDDFDFDPDEDDNKFKENKQETQKSINSLKQRINEHQVKLDEYKQNPYKFDNKELLKNAPNDKIRDRIINGRIKHLENEIKAFEKQIKKLSIK